MKMKRLTTGYVLGYVPVTLTVVAALILNAISPHYSSMFGLAGLGAGILQFMYAVSSSGLRHRIVAVVTMAVGVYIMVAADGIATDKLVSERDARIAQLRVEAELETSNLPHYLAELKNIHYSKWRAEFKRLDPINYRIEMKRIEDKREISRLESIKWAAERKRWKAQNRCASWDFKLRLYNAAKGLIAQRLETPSTVKFPGWYAAIANHAVNVQSFKNCLFKIRGYLDAQNRYGAMIRKHYTAKLTYTENGTWRLVRLNFF